MEQQREARIAVFEDNAEIRGLIRDAFAETGHRIIAEATSTAEARMLTSVILADMLELDVVIIGGQLGNEDREGQDTEETISLLRDTGIRTIGFSGLPLPRTDIDHGKTNSVWELPNVVSRLVS